LRAQQKVPRAPTTVFQLEDMGTGVLMAGTLGCLSPGTYSEAGPKFQGWRPRLTPKETNELSSRDRPGSRRAVAVGLIAESVMLSYIPEASKTNRITMARRTGSADQQIATRQKCSVRQVNMTISLAFLAP
jgi:hypothetical protein